MNIEKILKILIALSLIILLVLIRVYPLDNCDACRFNINGTKTKGAAQFLNLYEKECFKSDPLNLSNLHRKTGDMFE